MLVEGHQILDAIITANEAVGSWRKDKKKDFLLKLDFEKAYDKVDWSFLDAVLENKGFGSRCRMWIKGCMSKTNFSLINRRPRGKIIAQHGLRQGDPLSPFLFTLISDALSRLIHFCTEKNILRGFNFGCNDVELTHLQYADDVLVFLP